MADQEWARTREALSRINPMKAATLVPKLVIKGPGLVAKAQEMMARYHFADDHFKIAMIHELEKELPEFGELYEAILADIMADKLRLG